MATLRSLDMMTVDDLFIKDGYVLNFSDAYVREVLRGRIGREHQR
jgi:hypothetical protein